MTQVIHPEVEQLRSQLRTMSAMMDAFVRGSSTIDRLVRDQFAGHCAAASCWASDGSKLWSPKKIAQRAFDVADAMMVERKKRSK